MTYLFDTNVLIHVLRGREFARSIPSRIASLPSADRCICAIVREELMFGAYRSRDPATAVPFTREFLAPFRSLPFDDQAADEAARIRAALTSLGTPIGPHDVEIAGIALAHHATLVTDNTAEFARVPGLICVNWLHT